MLYLAVATAAIAFVNITDNDTFKFYIMLTVIFVILGVMF